MHHKILVSVQKLACWLPLSYCAAILYPATHFLHTTPAAFTISLTRVSPDCTFAALPTYSCCAEYNCNASDSS